MILEELLTELRARLDFYKKKDKETTNKDQKLYLAGKIDEIAELINKLSEIA